VNRLDAVRIRIGLGEAQTKQAMEGLGLQSITPSRSMLHLLDYRPGPALPTLVSAGVTISVHDSGDLSLLTVQVRHIRRQRLHPRWAVFYGQDEETLRVEEERDRTRRVLTASLTARSPHPGHAWTGADLRLADVLSPRQWSFLHDCVPGRPQPRPLTPLGPISVLSWTVRLDRVDVTVSRWQHRATDGGTETGLDVMEVSRGSLPAEAGFLHPALAASIRRRGLDPDGSVPWLEMRAARWFAESAPMNEQH
jgi:hypothetical protein